MCGWHIHHGGHGSLVSCLYDRQLFPSPAAILLSTCCCCCCLPRIVLRLFISCQKCGCGCVWNDPWPAAPRATAWRLPALPYPSTNTQINRWFHYLWSYCWSHNEKESERESGREGEKRRGKAPVISSNALKPLRYKWVCHTTMVGHKWPHQTCCSSKPN